MQIKKIVAEFLTAALLRLFFIIQSINFALNIKFKIINKKNLMTKKILLKKITPFILLFVFIFLLQSNSVQKSNSNKKIRVSATTFSWADSVFSQMTSDEKLGQLFMIAATPKQGKTNKAFITKLIKQYKPGGLIFFHGGPVQQAKLTNYYQSISKTPLMIAGDYEWGLHMRLDSTVNYPRQMMLGAIQNNLLINEFGSEVARQCKRIGININFAPVIDINNNPNNPVINSRSFGEQKENVALKGTAYMIGLQTNRILATGKHFPGHGDTDVNSHKNLPVILHSKSHLENIELYPFKKLIHYGLGGIIVAHLNIPALDSSVNSVSSLSKPIVTNLLKNELKYKGLIFTDALGMHGVTKYYKPGETEVAALLAGVDVLLMPKDVPLAFKRIKAAIKSGKLSQKDIDIKCKKILIAKQWMKLNNYKPIKTKHIYEDLNSEKAVFLNRRLTESALTLAMNKNHIIPFKNLDKETIASISIGNGFISNFQKRLTLYDDVKNYSINKSSDTKTFDRKLNELEKFDKVIVSIHGMSRRPPYFNIKTTTLNFIDKLSQKTNVILVLFGNPYALKNIKNPENLKAVLVSYNDRKITRDLSAQLLFGGITAQGKLPVSAGKLFPSGKGGLVMKSRLKYSTPFELNINQDTLQKIDSVINDAIIQEATPGAVIIGIKNGIVFYRKSFGYHTYNKKHKTKINDIFDLASVTKVTATLPIIMKLYEEKKINLNAKLSDYLPELKGTNKENLIIKDILTHQARLKPWIPFYIDTYTDEEHKILNKKIYATHYSSAFPIQVAKNMYIEKSYPDTVYKKIYESELRPKKEYKYSDLGFILFHKMIEEQTGIKQEIYDENNFYKKIGATTLGYLPLNKFNKSQIVPTEDDTFYRHQLVQGYVHDFAAAMLGGVSGHAGLFSNADDLSKMMQMYLQYGTYGGIRYFKPSVLSLFSSCPFCKNGNRRGIGFDRVMRPEGGPSSQLASDKSFGHSGFTGILVWMDPEYDFVYIFLSNRINPTAENRKLITMDVRTKIQAYFYKSFPEFDTLVSEKK